MKVTLKEEIVVNELPRFGDLETGDIFLFKNKLYIKTIDSRGSHGGLALNVGYTYSINDNEIVDMRVYAIELVYVPEGRFYARSGGTEGSAFYKYPTTTNPYQILSEDEVEVGTANDNLYYNYTTYGGDQLGPGGRGRSGG